MRHLFLFIFICIFTNANADILHVTSFKKETQDISARTHPRADTNGNDCALIKIQTTEDDLVFDGDIVGNILCGTSEYWVYLSDKSTFLIIKGKNIDPLTIIFDNYTDVMNLESKCTYVLKLQIEKVDYKISYQENYDGIVGGHKYIDLGLSVCWATSNVGATAPNEMGKLFAWGETNSKNKFDLKSYKYFVSESFETGIVLSKYNGIEDQYFRLVDRLEAKDDAASVEWKGNWKMPTGEELIELFTSCTFVEYKYHNTTGYVVTGPNGKTIFLPIASDAAFGNDPESYPSYYVQNKYDNKCIPYHNGYWSSYGSKTDCDPWAMSLVVAPNRNAITNVGRYVGCFVRPVIKIDKK